MSLTEYDREVLLQEIQQIQLALESTSGCNFNADSESSNDDDNDNDDDDDDDDDDNDYNQRGFPENIHKSNIENEESWNENYEEKCSSSDASFNLEKVTQVSKKPSFHLDENVNNVIHPNDDSVNFSNANGYKGKVKGLKEKRCGSSSNTSIEEPKAFDEFEAKTSTEINESGALVEKPDKTQAKISISNSYVEHVFKGYRTRRVERLSAATIMKGQDKSLKCSANLSTLENALQMNRLYQDRLNEELKKVELALARNRRIQDDLGNFEDGIQTNDGLSKACIGRFNNPYFKDGTPLGPPDNEDTKEKKIAALGTPIFTKPSKPWKKEESNFLEDGVYNNNLEKMLAPLMEKLRKIEKENKERVKSGREKLDKSFREKVIADIKEIKAIPRAELLKDSSDIDFFRISKNYLPAREEIELQLQWCNVLHPSINQSKFTKEEDSMILKLAKKYKNHEWEKIAKELGTNRTPIQCLQRFQRTLNKDVIKAKWDENDDKKLKEAVALYGNNWVSVAEYMGDRTTNQCMFRWDKSINPSIKKGKWSAEEDKKLLDAIKKCGLKNWKEVKCYVPGRTDAQCRERYVSSLDPEITFAEFTEEEDKKIIQLVEKYGVGKWSTIAKEMPPRRDNQICRRYKKIKSKEYHEYRKAVLWKKSSVLSYFLHRRDEKRDYNIKDLDVNSSPSLNPQEKKRVMRKKEELLEEGYSEEQITQKLAEMHYEGEFFSPIGYSRPKRTKPLLKVKEKSTEKCSENCSEGSSEKRKEIKSKSKNYMLCSKAKTLSVNPLPLDSCAHLEMGNNTSSDSQSNGVGSTESLVDMDVSFKRNKNDSNGSSDHETVFNSTNKDASNVIQDALSSSKAKTKSNTVSSKAKRLVESITQVIAECNIPSNELVFTKGEQSGARNAKLNSQIKHVESQKNSKNKNANFTHLKKQKNLNNGIVEKCEELLQKYESKEIEFDVVKKLMQSQFKKLQKENGVMSRSIIESLKKRLDSITDLQNVFDKEVDVGMTPFNTKKCVNSNDIQKRKSRKRSTVSKSNSGYPKKLKIVSETKSNEDDEELEPSVQQNSPFVSIVEEDVNITAAQGITLTTQEVIPTIQDDHPTTRDNTPSPQQITTTTEDVITSTLDVPSTTADVIPSTKDIPSPQHITTTTEDVIASNQDAPSTILDVIPSTEDTPSPQHITTTTEDVITSNQDVPSAISNVIPSTKDVPPTIQDVFQNISPTTQDISSFSQDVSHATQDVLPTTQHDTSTQDNLTQMLPALTDQLRTFTLLLSAFHINTAGVMQSLSDNQNKTPVQSGDNIPDCYPLSPGVPSLRGMRTLLLNRRILSEKVKSVFPINSNSSRDTSYRQTRTYDALQKRFRSMFLWPTFLATFIPKYTQYSMQPDLTTPINFVSLPPVLNLKSVDQRVVGNHEKCNSESETASSHRSTSNNVLPLKSETKSRVLVTSCSTIVPCLSSYKKHFENVCNKSLIKASKKVDSVKEELIPLESIKTESARP